MSGRLLGVLLIGTLAVAAPGHAADDVDRLLRELRLTALPGERPPAFTLPTVDGSTASLADHRGKVVLAVSIQEAKDLVAGYVKGAGITPPVLLDRDGAVARSYRVTATPTTFLIGRDGRQIARAAGTRPWDGPAGRALLDALVASPAK